MPGQIKNDPGSMPKGSYLQTGGTESSREVPESLDIILKDLSRIETVKKHRVASSLKELQKAADRSDYESLRVVVIGLAGHEQAIEVELVDEIIMAPNVSPLIKAPFFVEGVIRIRGLIVPVVDLKKALRLPGTFEATKDAVVVMVRLWGKRIGVRVDSVLELLTIPIKSVQPPKGVVGGVDARFMRGLTYVGDRFLVILDLEAMMSEDQEMDIQDDDYAEGPGESPTISTLDEKILTRRIISFILDGEIFGAEMGEVAEIMEMTVIMPVPNVPDFVMGLINLRGTIVPVIDLRILFGLDRKPQTAESRIVILKEENLLVGVVVDSMWESLRLSRDAFQPAPHSPTKVDNQYFRDISLVNGRVVTVLDISRILLDTSGRSGSSDVVQDFVVARPASAPNPMIEARNE